MSFAIIVHPRHAPAMRSKVFLAVAVWSMWWLAFASPHLLCNLWPSVSWTGKLLQEAGTDQEEDLNEAGETLVPARDFLSPSVLGLHT